MNREALIAHLSSISAIPVTPFLADVQIDYAAYSRLVRRLVQNGIQTVTPNGNTGEFYALSPEECELCVQAAVQGADLETLVMCGVGLDVATAVRTGRNAERAGAQAMMIHQPTHPFISQDGWITYHRAIADALPEMGVVLYMRDVSVTAAMISRLADVCPNLVGIKYAVANPMAFAAVVQQVGADRLAWICGLAEGWAPFFFVGGAQGFTSGLVNVVPHLSLEMLDSLKRSDYASAMRVWTRVKPFEDLRARRNSANNVPVVKEALAQMGLCERFVRPPITELPSSERAEVRELLASWSAD